jgi:hypothetical protein
MLVQVIKKVPDELFEKALFDATKIKWETRPVDHRQSYDVFRDSSTVHLRTHKHPSDWEPKTIEEWSTITECVDNPKFDEKFKKTRNIVNWVYEQVGGISLGRVMIINLAPRGKVALHVDPLDYFEKHSRYHIPLVTNEGVTFSGGPETQKEHMPLGYLCRLNNRLPHQLDNDSDLNRIHLLVDIETPDGNQIF